MVINQSIDFRAHAHTYTRDRLWMYNEFWADERTQEHKSCEKE